MVGLRFCITRHLFLIASVKFRHFKITLKATKCVNKTKGTYRECINCRLLIIFANSLDTDQAQLNVGPYLDPNYLTLLWYS